MRTRNHENPRTSETTITAEIMRTTGTREPWEENK